MSTAFQAHPYRWPVIGWRSDVENVSRDAIYQYYRTHYGPNNAVAVVVGDVAAAEALRLARQYFGPIKPIPKPPEVHTTRAAAARRASRHRPALRLPAHGDGRVEGAGGARPGQLRARRAVGRAGRGADEPALPGAGREGAGLARRRRSPEPPGSLPLLRERDRAAAGSPRSSLEKALLDEVERVVVEPDHRRGADPRPAARRGRLRLPDEQRDRAGASARLLGDDRRLALSRDLSRPGPRADACRHPGGRPARRSPPTRGPSATSSRPTAAARPRRPRARHRPGSSGRSEATDPSLYPACRSPGRRTAR